MLLDINDDDILQLERDLKRLSEKAYPFATLETLNKAVEGARDQIRGDLRNQMILRNQWTAGSVQYRKAKGLVVEKQAAEVGSMQEYMAEQEEGFTRRAKGKHGYPIPMPFASGQGGSRKRTRKVRAAHKLARIQLARHKARGANSKQRNVRTVQEAIKTGKRFVYMEFKQKKGIYKVIGGRKGTKRGWPINAKLRLVWSLTHKSYSTKKHKWLEPASDKAADKVPELYKQALNNQMKRLGILSYNGKINR